MKTTRGFQVTAAMLLAAAMSSTQMSRAEKPMTDGQQDAGQRAKHVAEMAALAPPVNEPERYPVRPRGFRAESLDGGHSHRLRTFRALVDLELDSLIFLKGAKTVPLDLRMVDENVFCAPVRGDKSETFFAAEPFHSSLCHTNFSLFKWM